MCNLKLSHYFRIHITKIISKHNTKAIGTGNKRIGKVPETSVVSLIRRSGAANSLAVQHTAPSMRRQRQTLTSMLPSETVSPDSRNSIIKYKKVKSTRDMLIALDE